MFQTTKPAEPFTERRVFSLWPRRSPLNAQPKVTQTFRETGGDMPPTAAFSVGAAVERGNRSLFRAGSGKIARKTAFFDPRPPTACRRFLPTIPCRHALARVTAAAAASPTRHALALFPSRQPAPVHQTDVFAKKED